MLSFSNIPTATRAEFAQIFSHPTWDVVLLLLLGSVGLFFVFSQARRRIVAMLIHTYLAATLVSVIPKERIAQFIGEEAGARIDIGLFVGIFLILFLFLSTLGAGILRTWWYAIVLIFLQLGLFLHIIFGFLSEEERAALAPLTKMFIANPDFSVWWFFAPVAALIIIRRLTLRYE